MRVQRCRQAFCLILLMVGTLAACSGGPPSQPSGDGGYYKLGQPYRINGNLYEPYYDPAYHAVGTASWYGEPFHGRTTANGERFDKRRLSAAHTTLPLPSLVEITNLENGRRIEVRVNDRGPFVGDRIIDVSEAAAEALGFKRDGLAEVEVRFLGLADARGEPPEPTVVASAPRAVSSTRARTASPRSSAIRATPPPAPVEPIQASACDSYFVQVGAFVQEDRARTAMATVEQRFASPIAGERVEQDGVTRVRVGPFTGVDAAHRALAAVAREGYGDAFIMRLGRAVAGCVPRAA